MSTHPLPLDRVYLAQTLSEPVLSESPEALFYVRVADGRRSVMRQSLATGLAQAITTEPMATGGVGYGGGIYAVHQGTLVYAACDGRLHGINLETGEQWAITPSFDGVATPTISHSGKFVAFLAEADGCCNVLVAAVRGTSLPIKVSGDPWYAFQPGLLPRRRAHRLAGVERA